MDDQGEKGNSAMMKTNKRGGAAARKATPADRARAELAAAERRMAKAVDKVVRSVNGPGATARPKKKPR